MTATHSEKIARNLINKVRPLLAGHEPDVQGAVLVELVALYLAGHAPAERERVLALHVEYVRRLLPVIERELFGPHGHPAGI